MRTRFGEITIGKIIIALFIIFIWTLICSSLSSGVEGFSFNLDIKSSSHLPMYIADAEIEGYYHNRARRI